MISAEKRKGNKTKNAKVITDRIFTPAISDLNPKNKNGNKTYTKIAYFEKKNFFK